MPTSGDELESIFGDIAAKSRGSAPTMPSSSSTAAICHVPPSELSTNALWFRLAGWHTYNSFPVASIDLCITKPGCRLLASLILAVVFHSEPETVELHLRHHSARVDLLRVRHEQQSWTADYKTTPESFSYWPGENARRPWTGAGHRADYVASRTHLPMIEITTRDELGPMGKGHPRRLRDRGRIWPRSFSREYGRNSLDASLEDNEQVEFDLEGEVGGYPGVAVGSAEMQIWLPGGLGYIDTEE